MKSLLFTDSILTANITFHAKGSFSKKTTKKPISSIPLMENEAFHVQLLSS